MKGWRLFAAGLVAAFAMTFTACAGRHGTREPQTGVVAHYRCDKCTETGEAPKKCCGADMKVVELAP